MVTLSTIMNKKVKKARSRKVGSVLKALPSELLVEVMAKVASNSSDDLFRTRLSCKEMNNLGQEDYVYQNVSLDKFHFNPWRYTNEYRDFVRRCGTCGNAEALYRRGVLELFNSTRFDFESGFRCLKEAAEKGHKEAKYVYGVFLVCVGGEMKQQGLGFLSSLEAKDRVEAREKIMSCMGNMWVNDVVVHKMFAYNARLRSCDQCGNLQDNFVTKQGWDDHYDESDDLNGCDACKMNRELNIFCDIMKGYIRVNLV